MKRMGSVGRSLAVALALALAAGRAYAGPGSVVNPANGIAYPTYYANSPTPGPVTVVTPTVVGNPLVDRQVASDYPTGVVGGAPVLVVVGVPLPAGALASFQSWNQASAGGAPFPSAGNTFNAYVLRPTGVPNQYTVVFDSGTLTVPALADPAVSALATYPLPAPVPVQAGDVVAFYGQGVPVDVGAGADTLSYPAPAAPAAGATISLGVDPGFPIYAQPRTYSFAAVVNVSSTTIAGGLRKFVDGLPGLNAPNNLGQQLTVATPDTTTYPGSDYYEIAIVEYTERMHSDLRKPTKLRGYVQKVNGVNGTPHYLGPVIVAQRDRPVRLKVFNELPVGVDFFIPVDPTVMGAGKGGQRVDGTACDPLDPVQEPGCASFSQNRAGVHLHGGLTPWISDGTPHQWITPAGEPSPFKAGVAARDVPDMNPPDPVNYLPAGGSITLYYPNQQSGRLMFYHDHAYGLTRLNVYSGMAAGYLLTDPVERALTPNVPDLPLVIQDKTFVPDDVAVQDSKWLTQRWGQPGDLWFPHIYEENQDPTCAWDVNCMNPLGRWDYGPWIWPPVQLPGNPGNPSATMQASVVPESFMDVMVVNGTVYPTAKVEPKAYRLRILNASNDRFLNLQLYYAITTDSAQLDPARAGFHDKVTGTVCDGTQPSTAACTEVAMVPRDGGTYATPWGQQSTVPFDGRPGGVPSPTTAGPMIVQIGTEGGLLPAAVVKNAPPIPITYDTDPKSMTVGNVKDGTFLLGPAERVDAVVDFSKVKPGSKLILYNDAPAAWPAGDQRYDYYTFGPDWTANGGAPSPTRGYGPNTRTVMQFEVVPAAAPVAPFDLAALQAAVPAAYAASQEKPLVSEPPYRAAFPTLPPTGQYVHINQTTTFTFVDANGVTTTLPIHQKAIAEEFDPMYGRMSSVLGTEAQVTGNQGQNTFGFMYVDPATEVVPAGETQIWKITHNGVDTHAIHFHLLNVQVINRVDWAGVVKPPDPNEVGWKETIRMNPLEDIIVAVRARPPLIPFTVPESVRQRDVTRPLGVASTQNQLNFTVPWPYNQPMGTVANVNGTTTTNDVTSYGWEYVWHCHILGHEENDMMRPLVMTNVSNYNTADVYPPTFVSTFAASPNGRLPETAAITLTATDAAPPRPAYLDTGIASFAYSIDGGPFVPVNGATAVIAPPGGKWPSNVFTISVTATDRAATPNVGTASFTYTIYDVTPPTLTWGAPTTAPTASGWYATPVTLPFTVADNRPGPITATPASPLVIATSGAAATGTVTVTDWAGNSATFTSPAYKVDLVPPTLTELVSPTQTSRGAGSQAVTISGIVSDPLSGVVTGNTAGSFTITDNKSATVTTGTFKINANGSYSIARTISKSNTTAGSRIYTIKLTVKDKAGNVGTQTATFTVL